MIVLFLLSNPFFAFSQDSCGCATTFEKMIQKIDENYIGYALTKKEVDKGYKKHIQRYRK